VSVGFLDRVSGRPPALLAQAFELGPVAKAVISLAPGSLGHLAEVNTAFCALFGHERAALVGKPCEILYGVEDRPEIRAALQRLAAGDQRPAASERPMVRRDGSRVWAATLASVAHDTDGTPYVIAEVVEVTDRHAAEEALRRSEEQFRAAFDAGLLGMAIAGEDGHLRRVNAAFEALTGRPAADLVGRQLTTFAHPEGAEYRIGRPDGTVAWARVAMSTVPGPDGTRDRLVQCEDVTGRRMAETLADREARRLRTTAEHNKELLHRATEAVQAIELERTAALAALDKLARSERRFAEVFDHSPVPKIVIGLRGTDRGRVLLANPAFRRLVGGAADLLFPELAQAADDLGPEPEWDNPGPAHEAKLRRADGTAAVVAVHLLAITDDRGPQSAVVQLLDITAEREARAALGRSEEQFRTAFDGSPVGLLIADEHGRFQRANPAAAALTGRPVSELIGLTHREITDPADLEASARARLALLRGADDVCYDKRLRHADGRMSWTRVTLSLIPGPAGRLWRLVQLQDITAERAAAAAREREVRRLRATLAVQREVTAAAGDRDTALRVVAARAVELFDAADGSVVELAQGDQMHYLATAGTLGPFLGINLDIGGSLSGRVLVTGTPAYCADATTDQRVDREACIRLGIGSMMIVPLRTENRVIGVLKVCSGLPAAFDETDGEQLALLADSLGSALRHADDAARNATLLDERTRALAALEASDTRFRLAFENSPLGLTLIGLNEPDVGRYLQVNPAMTAITGYRAEELTAMTYHDLVHPDDIPDEASVRAAYATGFHAYRNELRYRHKDGHVVWVSLCGAPVHDRLGRPLYLVSQVEDITAQRAAETQLRRQARLLELIPAAVIVRDLDGTIRWWNAGAEALYGWPLAAAAGKVTHRLLGTVFTTAGGARDVLDGLTRRGSWAGELEHLTADGRTVNVLSRQVLHHLDDGHGDQVLEINTDVTAARAAERALTESEQRLRAQFDYSAAGQIVRTLDGAVVQVNEAYAAMLGHTRDELAGIPDADLVHPDDLATVQREIAGLFAGDAPAFTHVGRLRHAEGDWLDVEATVSLVRDGGGRPKNLIAVVTDISARRAAERARDQAAAALAERNEELEAANRLKLDLIGMLGHEIGNPLSSIRGYAEILGDAPAALHPARRERAVEAIARQAGRLDEIVREVLAMVSIDAGAITAARQELSVRAEVAKALVAVDLERLPVLGPDARILCHPGHLQQILVNLLSNAAKYGGGATAVTISLDGTGHAAISVEDNGPGVPEEFRPRLFERLSRADRDAARAKGTGLGLYIVRGLAQANHGDVRHEPDPAGGSRFIVDLQTADFAH
jgi:PAS domain S-box-containing protein